MMVVDFYTKVLQGTIFWFFRSIILNLDDSSVNDFYDQSNTITKPKVTASQECVEKSIPKLKVEPKKKS